MTPRPTEEIEVERPFIAQLEQLGWQHLEGECDLNEAVERGIAATRQLAKRQLTWLRKWPDLRWIYTDQAGNLSKNELSDSRGGVAGEAPLALALNYLD